jgi:hypothetical protein
MVSIAIQLELCLVLNVYLLCCLCPMSVPGTDCATVIISPHPESRFTLDRA